MAEIQVIFPSAGDAIVHNERKATLWDECITWHILNNNPRVEKVKIEFDRKDAEFFPNKEKGSRHYYVKDLSTGRTIWGVAPNNGPVKNENDPNRRRLDKYTVSGLDADDKTVSALDPQIVNSDPSEP